MPIVNASSLGIVPNTSADQLAAINKAIANLSATGGGTLVFSAGTYRINGKIVLRSDVKLQGAGSDSTVFLELRANGVTVEGVGLNNIGLEGIKFDNRPRHTTGQSNHTIRLESCTNAVLTRLATYGPYGSTTKDVGVGDGIYITGQAGSGATSRNIMLSQIAVSRASRNGFACTAVNGLSIAGMTIDGMPSIANSAFDLEPDNGRVVQNVSVTDVTCTNSEEPFNLYAETGTVRSVTLRNIKLPDGGYIRLHGDVDGVTCTNGYMHHLVVTPGDGSRRVRGTTFVNCIMEQTGSSVKDVAFLQGDELLFEGCTFGAGTEYSVHDAGVNKRLILTNCILKGGILSVTSEEVSLIGCTIPGTVSMSSSQAKTKRLLISGGALTGKVTIQLPNALVTLTGLIRSGGFNLVGCRSLAMEGQNLRLIR